MDRRTFLFSSLAAPFLFKSGKAVMAAVTYNASDASITMNFADDPNAPAMTLWQLPSQHGPQMMGYVLRASNGQTIVFDGGWKQEAPYLVDILQK